MKTRRNAMLVAALAAGAVASPAPAAEPDNTLVLEPGNVPPHVKRRLEENARAGLPALIRYVNRSHFMHQLRVEDIVKTEAKSPARAEAAEPQPAQQPPTVTAERSSQR